MPTVELRLDPRYSPGREPAPGLSILTGVYAVPVQGTATFTTVNRWASLGDGVVTSIAGIAIAPWPIDITITRISVRLPGVLTGIGTADFGIYDFGANAFREDLFASIAAGTSSATASGTMDLTAGVAYCIECRRTGGSTPAISPTSLIIEYESAPADGYFYAQRDGSVASGVATAQFFPALFRGAVSASDGYITPTLSQKPTVVPKATTIKTFAMSNSTVPASSTTYQMSIGGTLTGPTASLPGASNPAFISPTTFDVQIPAATSAAEALTNWATLKMVSAGAISLQPNCHYAYAVDAIEARQWITMGWFRRLGSIATAYMGFNDQFETATQSNVQQLWTTPGRIKEIMFLTLPENTSGDKTYEFHVEIGGTSIYSITFTNNAATLYNRDDVSIPVTLGDLLSLRVQMNGGFTAGRSLNCMAVLGFEAD